MYLVASLQEEFGKIAPILAGYSSNERDRFHRVINAVYGPHNGLQVGSLYSSLIILTIRSQYDRYFLLEEKLKVLAVEILRRGFRLDIRRAAVHLMTATWTLFNFSR